MPQLPANRRCLPMVVVLAFCLTSTGRANVSVPDLVTDRPDQTESSETVRPGYVQFELGWTHVEDNDEADVAADSFPETLVRIGVLDNLEFRFGFDGYVWEDIDGLGADDGAGDLEIGLKWKMWEETGWRPQTAILAGTSVPAGQKPFSSDRFDPSVRLACSHTLTETLSLGYNVAGIWVSELNDRGRRETDASVAYSAVLGIALSGPLGTFVEFFGQAPSDGGKPANSIDAGFTYLLADNLQIDVLGGVGVSETADDWFVGAGLVWRLPQVELSHRLPLQRDSGKPGRDFVEDQFLGVVDGACQERAGGHLVAPAAELCGDLADVDRPSAPQRATNPPVLQFDQKHRHRHRSDTVTFVDQVLGVLIRRPRASKVLVQEILHGVAPVQVQLEPAEHGQHEPESFVGEVVKQLVVDLRRLDAQIDQIGRATIRPPVGVAELEPSGIGCQCDKQGLGHALRDGPTDRREKVEKDQSGGRGGRVDDFHLPQAVGCHVVIEHQHRDLSVVEIPLESRQLRATVGIDNNHQVKRATVPCDPRIDLLGLG